MKLIASLTSPYARKIRVILAEKALPFQLRLVVMQPVGHPRRQTGFALPAHAVNQHPGMVALP